MNGLEALSDLVAMSVLTTSKDMAQRLVIIKKDLEILYMLKKNMHIDSETFKDDNGEDVEHEYIAYNYWELDIENKEEYNKLKEWLLK